MNSYMLNLVIQYNFIFLYVYLVLIVSNAIKKDMIKQIFSGVLISLLYVIILVAHDFFGMINFPDSRYLIISYSAYFYGPISALPVLISVLIDTFLNYPNETLKTVFILILFVIIFSFLKVKAEKKSYQVRWYQILLSAFSIPAISIVYALIFFTNGNETTEATVEATSNALSIFGLTIGLTFLIFYTNNRERERAINIIKILDNEKELLEQNMEIRALYEEMAASEEALRENYDELENYKNKLEYMAFHNVKTGLKNRDALISDLIKNNSIYDSVLIYLRTKDLEYYINALGQTLIEILHHYLGEALKNNLVQINSAELYEISEGRFCILLLNFNEIELIRYIERIHLELSNASLVENMQINISFEVGGVKMTREDVEPSMWLEYAEIAMLEASNDGKSNVTWFNREMYSQKQYNTRLELDLQKAVTQDQLYVMYQPQYNKNSQVIGAEALLRWTHKEYGLISPAIFIPLAEKLGLIDGIGHFVKDQVISFILRMRKEKGIVLPIAINVSFLELINPDYFPDLNKQLETHGISAPEVHIEITETSFSNHLDNVYQNISHITNKNIELHLDDFGTGYSSISHLKDFPISAIKIDKSFVDSIISNHKIEQIVLTIIELAHRLDMHVIAEGVETEAQFKRLIELGCDYFQGYYFSKPVLEESFLNMI